MDVDDSLLCDKAVGKTITHILLVLRFRMCGTLPPSLVCALLVETREGGGTVILQFEQSISLLEGPPWGVANCDSCPKCHTLVSWQGK